MERLFHAEEGTVRVAYTAKADAETTGQEQKVSEEGTKIFMDIQVRDHKQTFKSSRCLHALTGVQDT